MPRYPQELTFAELNQQNVMRCREKYHEICEWSPTDWACAMAGECGEACNAIKKRRRGDSFMEEKIAEEIADMVIYADLLCERLGFSLAAAVCAKFNATSAKVGSERRLPIESSAESVKSADR